MNRSVIREVVVSGLVSAACVFGYNYSNSVGVDGARDGSDASVSLNVVADKPFNKIQFNERVPMFHMVDTNGNFYLPLGSYTGATNTPIKYVALSRVVYEETGTYTLAFSTNEFIYVENEGFKEVPAE